MLVKNNIPFVEVPDEAAFYGPKIDVQIWSATAEFTLATNQVDFAAGQLQPDVRQRGEDEMPLVLHRAPLSTHERMIGFPSSTTPGTSWCAAPEQVRVIPSRTSTASTLSTSLTGCSRGVLADRISDRMGNKIRQAQLKKVPTRPSSATRDGSRDGIAAQADGTQINAMPVDERVALVTSASPPARRNCRRRTQLADSVGAPESRPTAVSP